MDLRNKVALITGGARMGTPIALALAQRGCRIALTYRASRRAAEKSASDLQALGFDAVAFKADVTQLPDLPKLVRQIDKRFGRLDIVVNLASIYESNPTGQFDPKRWSQLMTVHAEAAYQLSATAAPLLRRSGSGRVIHFSDWTAASSRPRYNDYGIYYVAKAAVKSVVESLALQLAPDILVNGIAPGPILPPPEMDAEEKKSVEKATPLGRWGGVESIVHTVVFLAETDFVTGETIRVDGGRHLH